MHENSAHLSDVNQSSNLPDVSKRFIKALTLLNVRIQFSFIPEDLARRLQIRGKQIKELHKAVFGNKFLTKFERVKEALWMETNNGENSRDSNEYGQASYKRIMNG